MEFEKAESLLGKRKIARISHAQLRRILRARGLRFRRNKQKLISEDPKYWAKKARIQRLLKHPNCLVLFEDEKRIVAKAYGGYEWCFQARTIPLNQRIRGKEVLFIAYNPHSHKLIRAYLPDISKESFFIFLRLLLRKTEEDIYLILDNHPSHKSRFAKRVFKGKKIKPIWLPKNAPELKDADKIIFQLIQRESSQQQNLQFYR